ncbi:hypothetical protein DFH08DRAFT_902353 [Mycena albidolilacea]|uniref:Uncharacterized protein n=1 Tax=Mycena albidolilacea TaxID=1033008 RepID=A0AAD7E9U2_9AGAR|nr:hypothetical protein DFH08DRAFT_902353 [Mycena albidolilacea]
MDSAEKQEQSQNPPDLPEKTAHLSESTVNVKAKRRQGVSDLHIPPLALFSLGTLGSADPDWQFTHCASDSESGDGEDEVFEFPRPPKSGLEVSAFFSRYSHSPHSSVDSTSTSGSWHLHSECSSPTSSGPPATPTSSTIRPLSIKKRNTAMGPLPSPGRFAPAGPSLPRSATISSPPRSSSLPPRSPSPPSSPSTPSPSPQRTVESEEQAPADDEFYAVQARGFVTLAQSESARKSGVIPIFPSTSTSTSTAHGVPVRPRRPPPPPPLVDAALCSFSPPAASTPSSHLRNSHVHTNSASYPRARIATSDAHARPRSSSTSTSSSYSFYSTSSTTGQAALSSVCFPSSYTAPAPPAASRSRSPSASRPRTGLVPNFSRPTPSPSGATSPARALPPNPSPTSPSCPRRRGDSARLITRRALDRVRGRGQWLRRPHLQQGTTRRRARCLDTLRAVPCQCVREAVEWSEAANSSNHIPLSFNL